MQIICSSRSGFRFACCAILLLALFPSRVPAYSVLAHEAIIDVVWDSHIRPLLLKRFPAATTEELQKAHGYAYGGAIIQDLGYYPQGDPFYTDLVHYIRSGDFIRALIRDSRDLNEYAFALGALSHLSADQEGHRMAVNLAVPKLYPKLRAKFSDVITYEDDPASHLKTEFGFDVLQMAKGHYAPDSYHDFIGFFVSKELLERAFADTYSIELRSVMEDLDGAIESYRHVVSTTIPRGVRIAWALKKKEIEQASPGITQQTFMYNISRASYEKEWGTNYKRPGFKSKFLAFLVRILPKIGPLKALAFRTPTAEVEALFMNSFNATIEQYQRQLVQVGNGSLVLPNINLDTGNETAPGIYLMQAEAYARLLDRLAKNQFQNVSPQLRSEILSYLQGLGTQPINPMPKTNRKDKMDVDWQKISEQLDALKTAE